MLLLPLSVDGQDRSNPFEITSRLPQSDGSLPPGHTYSPFDVRRANWGTTEVGAAPGNSDGLTTDTGPAPTAIGAPGPLVIQSADPDAGQGSLLAANLLLFLGLAVIWMLYGKLFRQCLRAIANASLLKQLFTRRSGGELSALWVGYLFFNLALGFFLYLVATRYGLAPGTGLWSGWLLLTLVVAGVTGLKQWLLWVYARVFPVRKEVSYYAFIVMVFCILTGLFLVPVNLLISYARPGFGTLVLYAALGVLVLLYGFHLLRGGLVAREFVFRRPVHIMLYICAVEIAPLLLIYRYLNNSGALS